MTPRDWNPKDVRQFITARLRDEIEGDWRLATPNMTEYTLQSLVWDKVTRAVGTSWSVLVEATVPETSRRADIVMYKLRDDNQYDQRHGSIAMEIKPHGQIDHLQRDLSKLREYIDDDNCNVNFGVLIYKSPQRVYEADLKKMAREWNERKLAVIRVNPNGRP